MHDVRDKVRRFHVHGVEVRDLPPNHKLHGEQGLFATRKFSQFDIIGEYTGRVVDKECYGHYVACLEDSNEHDESVGIDAEQVGNEMRFINSYLNIAFSPNVAMRTVYIDTHPRIIIVCIADIDIDDELLLDYGKAYNEAYLGGGPRNVTVSMSDDASQAAWGELPGDVDDDTEEL